MRKMHNESICGMFHFGFYLSGVYCPKAIVYKKYFTSYI